MQVSKKQRLDDTKVGIPPGSLWHQQQTKITLNSVAELLAWQPPGTAAARAASAPNAPLPARPRVLHCHDMAGGYNQMADETYLRAFSGWGQIDMFFPPYTLTQKPDPELSPNPNRNRSRWEEIDVFVYFAHSRVSMPPQAWLDACHAHGVPCLATFITENGEEGESQRRPRTPRARSPDPQSLLEAWPEAYQQPTNIQSPDRPPSTLPLTRRARARRVLYTTLHLTSVHTSYTYQARPQRY